MFSSHRGYVDAPAVVYAVREKFGPDIAIEYENVIDEAVQESKSRYEDQDINIALPSVFEGEPEKADPQGASSTPLFENIKGIG